jgi:serine/threonine-protein kinase
VGRQEQQLARVREDKAQVYKSAKQAWEKGDVTSALSRLEVLIGMDRDNPETDTGRSATYQSFYNLVHSEHNALKNAYEEARRNLEADGFEAALAVSKLYLSKYPNHALFQALLFDVENRQRQKLSAAIAETDRRVQAEPDLDRRVGILVEALKLYPNEPHFEGALRSVRDKRDLVTSIVAKARYFEERGQFTEALDQWQILKSIHGEQPELAFEIPRLIKRRDQQARETSRGRLLEQVNKYLEDGDYDRAMLTAQNALVEFPEESGFLELQTLVRQSQERGRKASELLARAQETAEEGSLDMSIELLREAHRIDSRSTIVRTVLVNSLLDRGRRVVDSDWHAAEELLREVLQLEPNCVPAESLANRIADRKPKPVEAVEPAPPRPEATPKPVGPHIRTSPTIPTPPGPPPPPAKSPAASPPAQPKGAAGAPTLELPIPPAAPAVPAATPPPLQSAAGDGADTPPFVPATSPPPLSRTPGLGPWPPSPKALSRWLKAHPDVWPPSPAVIWKIRYGLIGAAAILIVMSVITLTTRVSRPKASPTLGRYRVSLISSPLGAQIKLNGQPCGVSSCDSRLGPGTYRAEAQLAGYLPAVTDFNVSVEKGAPLAVELTLVPVPLPISISTDLPDGSVLVDGVPAGQIQGGGATVSSIAPGSHEVSVQSGELRASFTLEVAEGIPPRISTPMQVKGVRLFAIVESGANATWYGSETDIKISLDGRPVVDLVSEGLEMKDLAAGTHELIFNGPAGQQDKMVFESKTSTAVFVRMSMALRGKQ